MDIKEEVTVTCLLIKRMGNGEREESLKKSWLEFYKKEKEERCFCAFALSPLVLHLLGYNVCWFYP